MSRIWFALLLLVLMLPVSAQEASLPEDPEVRLQRLLHGEGLTGPARSLSYAEAVATALERSLDLSAARYEVPISEAQYDEAVAARNPTLAENFFYVHQDRNLVQQNLPNTRFVLLGAGYTVTQATLYLLGQNQMLARSTLYFPIYTGGRLESQMHLAAALTEIARYGLERTRQRIGYEARRQYLAALLACEEQTVAEQVQLRANQVLSYAQQRLRAGVGTKLDVLQADVSVATSRDALVRTRSGYARASADLAALLDLPLLTRFELPVGLAHLQPETVEPLPAGELQELAETALGQRPELNALRHELVANQERGNVARADALPQLGLNLNYDVIGNPSALRGGFSMLVTLSIPIYDGGVSSARIQQFHLRDLQLKTEELKLIQDITVEVRRGLLDLEESSARLQTAVAARDQAAEALRISSLRYQVGAGASLELVTAQTVLANAEFALADARYRQLLARAELRFALGSPAQ